jgi:glycosyltransferase involved in cell wall biosynthesis
MEKHPDSSISNQSASRHQVPLSLVIPVRNGEPFIFDTIAELCASTADFELVVVDDGSTDGTRETVSRWAARDPRVRLVENPGTGKVQALNFGFTKTSGMVIKCIDADDIMMRAYVDHLSVGAMAADEAECHDMHLTDRELNPIGCYRAHPTVIGGSKRQVIEQLISLPRPSWSFGRSLAERIFPMPDDLPFEDVWFAAIIKRFASRIRHCPGFCYQYRQHGSQTFGGILNHSREVVTFRAERMLRLIEVLVRESPRLAPDGLEFDTSFSAQRRYWDLLRKPEVSNGEIFWAPLPLVTKVKLLLFRRLPWAIPRILRCKYGLDALRLNLRQRLASVGT